MKIIMINLKPVLTYEKLIVIKSHVSITSFQKEKRMFSIIVMMILQPITIIWKLLIILMMILLIHQILIINIINNYIINKDDYSVKSKNSCNLPKDITDVEQLKSDNYNISTNLPNSNINKNSDYNNIIMFNKILSDKKTKIKKTMTESLKKHNK